MFVKGRAEQRNRPQFELVKRFAAVHTRDIEDGDEEVPWLEEGGQPILRRRPFLLPRPQKFHSFYLHSNRAG